jgi:hypothetical protein
MYSVIISIVFEDIKMKKTLSNGLVLALSMETMNYAAVGTWTYLNESVVLRLLDQSSYLVDS